MASRKATCSASSVMNCPSVDRLRPSSSEPHTREPRQPSARFPRRVSAPSEFPDTRLLTHAYVCLIVSRPVWVAEPDQGGGSSDGARPSRPSSPAESGTRTTAIASALAGTLDQQGDPGGDVRRRLGAVREPHGNGSDPDTNADPGQGERIGHLQVDGNRLAGSPSPRAARLDGLGAAENPAAAQFRESRRARRRIGFFLAECGRARGGLLFSSVLRSLTAWQPSYRVT